MKAVEAGGQCGAKARGSDRRCGQAAGWGTCHPGFGTCKLHGGCTPNHVTAAAKLERRAIVAGALALAGDVELDPNDTPETALRRIRTAFELSADGLAAAINERGLLVGDDGGDVNPLLDPWRKTMAEARTANAALMPKSGAVVNASVAVGVQADNRPGALEAVLALLAASYPDAHLAAVGLIADLEGA